MEANQNKTEKLRPTFKETLAFDPQGKPIILRSSENFRESAHAKPAAAQGVSNVVTLPKQEAPRSSMGSMRLFGSFDALKSRMQNKVAS